MTPDEAIKLLAEILEPYARREYIHASHPIGWTCLDDVALARFQPEKYTPSYRQKILDGEELCHGCRAAELLDELGLGGKS